MPESHYAHGKLLLTGEYFVLDGALALAVPTRYGQSFRVEAGETGYLRWTVRYPGDRPTRTLRINKSQLMSAKRDEDTFRDGFLSVLRAADHLRPGTTDRMWGKAVDCRLEFPADWGLGSSSTLLHFLAGWLEVDVHALLAKSFGGSGYDLACAAAKGPLLYRRTESSPEATSLNWQPEWLAQTYFVHLNRKQNSREGIRAYRKAAATAENIAAISALTRSLTDSTLHLRAAAQILEAHEELVSGVLGIDRVQQTFPDFPGTLKSLGAWGGDFIWALSEEPAEKVKAYFNERGYGTFIPYHDMAL
jgi:mevalonate kinase